MCKWRVPLVALSWVQIAASGGAVGFKTYSVAMDSESSGEFRYSGLRRCVRSFRTWPSFHLWTWSVWEPLVSLQALCLNSSWVSHWTDSVSTPKSFDFAERIMTVRCA